MKLVCALAALVAGLAVSAHAAPLETYAQFPAIDRVALSDDGSMIAIALYDGARSSLLVRPVASEIGSVILPTGETRLLNMRWIEGGRVSFTVEVKPQRSFAVPTPHVFDPATKKIDPKDTKPGAGKRQALWWWGEDGRLVDTNYNATSKRWTITVNSKVLASGVSPIGAPTLIAKGKSPDTVLMRVHAEARDSLKEFNRKTGEWSEVRPVSADADFLVEEDGELFGLVDYSGDEVRFEFLRASDQAMLGTLQKSFPNDRITIASWSKDHKVVVLRLERGGSPPSLVLVDLTTKKASFIGNVYGGLAKADIAEVKPVAYKAVDGLDIHGYLTLPNGGEARGLPLVVLVHDLVEERDALGYHWWAQALASRGYAVLQSNYRGSAGYGRPFRDAAEGELGQKMQTDLSDGVRALARQGVIDPKRVCIAGEVYGGYAALTGIALEPDVYRCAVAVDGLSDLPLFITSGVNPKENHDAWLRMTRSENVKDKRFAEVSPARNAERIGGPVLVVHGNDSGTLGYEQNRVMVKAMNRAGKSVEELVLDDGNRRVSETNARLSMLKAMVAFLEKNNPPN